MRTRIVFRSIDSIDGLLICAYRSLVSATAKNYAAYANDGGVYDEVMDFLKKRK